MFFQINIVSRSVYSLMCLPGTSARNKWIKDTTGVIIARANPKSFLLLMMNWNNITALFWTTTRAGKHQILVLGLLVTPPSSWQQIITTVLTVDSFRLFSTQILFILQNEMLKSWQALFEIKFCRNKITRMDLGDLVNLKVLNFLKFIGSNNFKPDNTGQWEARQENIRQFREDVKIFF